MRKKSVRKAKLPSPQSAPDSPSNDSSIFSVLTKPISGAPLPLRLSIVVLLGVGLIGFKVWDTLPDDTKKVVLAKITSSPTQPAKADDVEVKKNPEASSAAGSVAEVKKPDSSVEESNKSDKKPQIVAVNRTPRVLPPVVKQPAEHNQGDPKTVPNGVPVNDIGNLSTNSVNKPTEPTAPATKTADSSINCLDFKDAREGKDYIPEKCRL